MSLLLLDPGYLSTPKPKKNPEYVLSSLQDVFFQDTVLSL